MTSQRRTGLLVLLLAVSMTASGCSTVSRINPFHRSDKGPKETASEGKRIAITAFDDKVEPAEGLKGADFFLPDAQPVAQWALPGGTPEQSIEHVEADVPARGSPGDVAVRDHRPERESRSGVRRLELPAEIVATPVVFEELGLFGAAHDALGGRLR